MNGGICMHAHNNITICCRVGCVYPMVQCCIFRCWKRVQRQRIGDTLMICWQHVGQYVAHNTLSAFFWRQCLSYQKNNYDMLAHGVAQRDDKRVACQEATQLPAAGTRVWEGGAMRERGEGMQQQAGATRGREGGTTRGWWEAMRQPANATMRGRQEEMQQPAGTTRWQEGSTTRGDTTSPSLLVPNKINWQGGSHGRSSS